MTLRIAPVVESAEEIERLRQHVLRRRFVRQTRLTGDVPLSIDSIGDARIFRLATGDVTDSGTTTIYFTENAQVGGRNIFTPLPTVSVLKDKNVTSGGLPRADAPLAPSKNMNLTPHTNFEICWFGPNEVWGVVITNDTGSTANFVVDATGVA